MRTQEEMYELIINIAKQDERIRAVYMNGSRTNRHVPTDIFQDYDIVYVVTETAPFYLDEAWIDCFGERLYMQMPDKMDGILGKKCRWDEVYGWLMQFADGNRIDLHVESASYAQSHIKEDKLCRILLDKDNILPNIPKASEEDYYVKRPTEEELLCACNEFWWCLNNVAKGLWREEVPYVMDMLNYYIRPQVSAVLSWKIGIETGFSCSVGKSGKYMKNYVSPDVWEKYLQTYPDAGIGHIWEAVFVMCDLMEETAAWVAQSLAFRYEHKEAKAGREYLIRVRNLPKDAKEV